MAGYYKWNIVEIAQLSAKIGNETAAMKRDSQGLNTLRSEVETSWQSVSGMVYAGDLEFNKAELDMIIFQTDELKSDLDKAVRHYTAAEGDIRGILNQLRSQIRH